MNQIHLIWKNCWTISYLFMEQVKKQKLYLHVCMYYIKQIANQTAVNLLQVWLTFMNSMVRKLDNTSSKIHENKIKPQF